MKKFKVLILVIMISLIYPISIYTLSSVNYSALPVMPQNQPLSTKNGATYNDTLYPDQWAVPMVGANLAHASGLNGTNVTDNTDPIVVAVLDTGIDLTHQDLNDHYQSGGKYYYGSSVQDGNGHGTHCCGIIGAVMNNSIGVVGVAPNVTLMAYKVLDDTGSGNLIYLRQAIDDIMANYPPSQPNGVNVISMSLGVDIPDYDALAPADKTVMDNLNNSINAAAAAGIILVAAAGNENMGRILYPAKFPNVIAVGAVSVLQERASYSNWGPELEYCAPGGDYYLGLILVGVLSTYPLNTYAYLAGTSMATPVVAGVIALLLANGTDPAYIRGNLTALAKDLGSPGWDQYYGNGMVQIVPNNWDYNTWFHQHYDLEIFLTLMFMFGDLLTPKPPMDYTTIAIIASVAIFFIAVIANEIRYRK